MFLLWHPLHTSRTTSFSHSIPSTKCSVNWKKNLSIAQIEAKYLLRTQYEFMILESFSDPFTPYFFQTLLREPNLELIQTVLKNLTQSRNSGFLSLVPSEFIPSSLSRPNTEQGTKRHHNRETEFSSLYSSFFPKSVLSYLLEDNAADIELYQFAVELYRKRIEKLKHQHRPRGQPVRG
jgi:hypothetical protein